MLHRDRLCGSIHHGHHSEASSPQVVIDIDDRNIEDATIITRPPSCNGILATTIPCWWNHWESRVHSSMPTRELVPPFFHQSLRYTLAFALNIGGCCINTLWNTLHRSVCAAIQHVVALVDYIIITRPRVRTRRRFVALLLNGLMRMAC